MQEKVSQEIAEEATEKIIAQLQVTILRVQGKEPVLKTRTLEPYAQIT